MATTSIPTTSNGNGSLVGIKITASWVLVIITIVGAAIYVGTALARLEERVQSLQTDVMTIKYELASRK